MMQNTIQGAQYTFDNFEVTKANRKAFEKAKQFAENADAKPLAVFGGVASGKTHLLYAAANTIRQNAPELRVLVTTTADMQASMERTLRDGGTAGEFREQYLQADVLLVDDIQETVRMKALQNELILIFDAFDAAGKRFMMTSAQKDAHWELNDRLVIRSFRGDFAVITASYMYARFPYDRERAAMRQNLLYHLDDVGLDLLHGVALQQETFKQLFKDTWQYFARYIGCFDVDRTDVQLIGHLNRIYALLCFRKPSGMEECVRQTCMLFLNALIYTLTSYDIRAYRGGFYAEGVLFVPLPHRGGTPDMIELRLEEFDESFDRHCEYYSRNGRF